MHNEQSKHSRFTVAVVSGVLLFVLVLTADVLLSGKNAPAQSAGAGNTAVMSAPESPSDSTESSHPAKAAVKTPNKEEENDPTPNPSAAAPTAGETEEGEETAQEAQDEPHYDTPPKDLNAIAARVSPAVVNIFCTGSPTANGISGSGVIIDPRGIILTNAHVAQYVLLQNFPRTGTFECAIRTGSPAQARYRAKVLFMPSQWVKEHAEDITKERPTGTGEHDWALLYITGTVNGGPLQNAYPSVSFDTREAVTEKNEEVLISGYPAGFLGGIAVRSDLWPVSTVANIQDFFTFHAGTVDIISLGGTILAQTGSSGGAVVNAWEKLVGIVVTSSEGETTAERDLRAVTLFHINESIVAHTEQTLAQFLQNDPAQLAAAFERSLMPVLRAYYSDALND